MKFLACLAVLASTVSSTPLIPRSPSSSSKSFHLKTSDASGNDNHNNLFVYAYHTGAGLNDAVLSTKADQGSPAFLNGTKVQFDLDTPFPWGLKMTGDTNYAGMFFAPLYIGLCVG